MAHRFISVGALYPGTPRGLTSDLLAAYALGAQAYPVCTALAMAARGVVTDFTEVPEDSVRAQLEHLSAVASPAGMKIGVLAGHGAAHAAFDAAERLIGPVVLDLQVSGPHGETVLSSRGLEVVQDRLGVADIVLLDQTDAELLSGGEIRSLDDVQVAVQRIAHRGARAVVVKCGPLPSRHFEAEGDGAPEALAADLYYDGTEFALFEAPFLPGRSDIGASGAHAVSLLLELIEGKTHEVALQNAKRYVTEALRDPRSLGSEPSLDYLWDQGSTTG